MVAAGRIGRVGRFYAAAGVTIGVGLILFLAYLLLEPHDPNITGYERPTTPANTKAEDREPCEPNQLRLVIQTVHRAKQTIACADAPQPEQPDYQSLDYAARSANAAEQAVIVGQYQAKVFLGQALAAVGAFIAAAFAVFFARQAAKSAADTLDQSRISTELELRAYIHAVDFKSYFLSKTSEFVLVQIGWSNLGDTPATNCSSEVNKRFFDSAPPDDFDFPDPPEANGEDRFSLGRDQRMFSDMLQISRAELAQTTVKGKALYVVCTP